MMAFYLVSPGATSSLSLSLTLMALLAVACVFAPQPVRRSKRVMVWGAIAVALAAGTGAYAFNLVDWCSVENVSWFMWIANGCYLP